jgi:hypothetical protein
LLNSYSLVPAKNTNLQKSLLFTNATVATSNTKISKQLSTQNQPTTRNDIMHGKIKIYDHKLVAATMRFNK